MTQPQHASLRLKSDDFVFSSVISHHDRLECGGVSAAPRRTFRVPAAWRSLVAALGAALLLAGCQAETAPAPKSERPVQVQRVAFETGAHGARVRRRRARPLRDRSRLPRRRQDRDPRRQCRRPRARRRRHRAARSAGSPAAGRERRSRARRGDLEPVAGGGRPAALRHAEGARLCRRSPNSTASRRRTTRPKAA